MRLLRTTTSNSGTTARTTGLRRHGGDHAGPRSARSSQPHGFYMATHSGEDVVSCAAADGPVGVVSIETLGVDNVIDLHAGTFIDIGANLGYFSFLFARRGYRVFAVEPLFANWRGIEATFCLNKEFAAEGRFTIITPTATTPTPARKDGVKLSQSRQWSAELRVGEPPTFSAVRLGGRPILLYART